MDLIRKVEKNSAPSAQFRIQAVGQNYFASWHPCGKYLVCGLFDRHILLFADSPKILILHIKEINYLQEMG